MFQVKAHAYGRIIDLGENAIGQARKRWAGELSPEPETAQWIASLPVPGVLWDIGANVGLWSVHAAVRGLKVLAFEPHPKYFESLRDVMTRNNLDVICLNTAVSSVNGGGALEKGRSKHTFVAGSTSGVPAVSVSLDVAAKTVGPFAPDYIKIDVDGNELDILRGGVQTFAGIKSALIEVDPQVSRELPNLMAKMGFTYDVTQVEASMIKEGKYRGTANYIFYRRTP